MARRMYATGHYGMALLVYAPVGALALLTGHDGVALVGAGGVLALAKLPDIDRDLVFVSHRGVTHTLAFVLAFSLALGASTFLVVSVENGPVASLTLAGFAFLVGALAVGSHLLADVLTPTGVVLFWPVSSRTYTLDVARSDNIVANYLLLALGIAVSLAVLFAVATVR